MKNINRILTTLSLAASDTREDTIKSIVRTTLKETITQISLEELIENIYIIYDIELHHIEFNDILRKLQEDGEIEVNNGSHYILSHKEREKLIESEAQLASEEVIRYQNLKNFISERFPDQIGELDCKLLWKTLKNYFYGCFFQYGIKALEMLHPKYAGQELNNLNQAELISEASKELKTSELILVFKTVVDFFPDFATKEDLDFIDEIGQKTLAFASLGLSPEEVEDQININLVNWTLYLDTNFLFSILDLHSNVENEASKELLKLIIANKNIINIQFRYTELTLKELRRKKSDFKSLDETLTNSAINAILKSDDLDDFARQYYSKLLIDRKNTIHPSQVIDLAEVTLPNLNIQIARKQKQMDALGESFIGERINEYQRYIDQRNATRAEQSKAKSFSFRMYYRSESQLTHDIILRELILSSRKQFSANDIQTFNEVKYFGVTIDDLLIRFDQYKNGFSATTVYPTFFKPSFLLNKLVRLLPVKTDNYKKAFIKAVSSRGYYKESDKSNDIIKVASYLKSMGIDNEEILLNLISEKLFMEKFRQESSKKDFNSDTFFESEINQIIVSKEKEIQVSRKEIFRLEDQQVRNIEEKENLKSDKTQREEEVRVLSRAVFQLKKQVQRLENEKKSVGEPELNFREPKESEEILALKKQLSDRNLALKELENSNRKSARKKYIKKQVLYWRLRAFGYILLCLTGLTLLIVYINNLVKEPGVKVEDIIQKYRETIAYSLSIWVLGVFFSGFLMKRFSDQYSASNVNAFKASIEKDLPDELKEIS